MGRILLNYDLCKFTDSALFNGVVDSLKSKIRHDVAGGHVHHRYAVRSWFERSVLRREHYRLDKHSCHGGLAPNDGAVEVRCEFDDDTYSWKVIAYKEFVCSKPCISDDCNRNRIIVCAATTIPVMQEIDWKAPGEAGEPR